MLNILNHGIVYISVGRSFECLPSMFVRSGENCRWPAMIGINRFIDALISSFIF